MKMNKTKGFTLIELLVVIAIIGILSSVVLASLNTARKKSRDAKRISDIKQIQLALELYFDSNGGYPSAITNTTMAGFLPAIPVPPDGTSDTAYLYQATKTDCMGYRLGVTLEDAGHTVLDSDIDTAGSDISNQCPNESSASTKTAQSGADPVYMVEP